MALLGIVSPACGDRAGRDDAATEPTVIEATTTTAPPSAATPVISATEYSFTVPAEIKGGTALAPGASRTYTAVLEPGTHAVFDPLFSPDGERHSTKGQVSAFTVTPGDTGAALPSADVTVKSIDHRFKGLDGLRAGDSTVRFENSGREPHELLLFEMAPGKTGQDLAKFLSSQGPRAGPPPFVATPGLVAVLLPGQSAVASLTLKPGTTYTAICLRRERQGAALHPGDARGRGDQLSPRPRHASADGARIGQWLGQQDAVDWPAASGDGAPGLSTTFAREGSGVRRSWRGERRLTWTRAGPRTNSGQPFDGYPKATYRVWVTS